MKFPAPHRPSSLRLLSGSCRLVLAIACWVLPMERATAKAERFEELDASIERAIDASIPLGDVLPIEEESFAPPDLTMPLQEVRSGRTILAESEITEGVDPSRAVTVAYLDIPVNRLTLLVRPMTLQELEVEAAAWLLLLRDKIQNISQAEGNYSGGRS